MAHRLKELCVTELRRTVKGVVAGGHAEAGLIFFGASVLAMALILLGVWLLRALWAKPTGQPVNPPGFSSTARPCGTGSTGRRAGAEFCGLVRRLRSGTKTQ
jgi:hypothetical protein